MKSQQSKDCNSSRHIENASVIKKEVDKRIQQALQDIDEDASLSIPKKIKLSDIKSYFAKKQLVSKRRPQRLRPNSLHNTVPRNDIIELDITNNNDSASRSVSPSKQQPLVSKFSIVVHKDSSAITAPVVSRFPTMRDASSQKKHERIDTRNTKNSFGKVQQNSEIDFVLEETKNQPEEEREPTLIDGGDHHEGVEPVKGESVSDLSSASNTKIKTSSIENNRGNGEKETEESDSLHFGLKHAEHSEHSNGPDNDTENHQDASRIFNGSGFGLKVVTRRHSRELLNRNSQNRENHKEKAQSDSVHATTVDTSEECDENKHGITSDFDDDARRSGVADSKSPTIFEIKKGNFESKLCISKPNALERIVLLDKAASKETLFMPDEKNDQNTYQKTSRFEKQNSRKNSHHWNKGSKTSSIPLKSTTLEGYEEEKQRNSPRHQQLNKGRACDECQRRKVKCDTIMNGSLDAKVSRCSYCLKSKRDCSFERESSRKKSQPIISPGRKDPALVGENGFNSSIEQIQPRSFSKTAKPNSDVAGNIINNEVLQNKIPLISPSGRMILDGNNLLHPSSLKLEATMQTKALFPSFKNSIFRQMSGSVVPFLNKFSKSISSEGNSLYHINDKTDNDIYGFHEGSAMFDSSIATFAGDEDDFIKAQKNSELSIPEDQSFPSVDTSKTALSPVKKPYQYAFSEVSPVQNEEAETVPKPSPAQNRIQMPHRTISELNEEEQIIEAPLNDSTKMQKAYVDQEILDVESDDTSDDSDTSDIVMISDEETYRNFREGTPYKRG